MGARKNCANGIFAYCLRGMSSAYRKSVRLLGVLLKQQGSHDSLCAYYAAAMLLCALRPQFEEAFEAPSVELDPIFANLGHAPGTLHARVCTWLAGGERLSTITQALNRACISANLQTTFRLERAARSIATRKKIEKQIDLGLPTVLAWRSPQMGLHTVTVVGYEHYGRASAWLKVHDPGQIQTMIEWAQLVRMAKPPFELITCITHAGPRPQRMQTFRDRDGALIPGTTAIAQWNSAISAYIAIDESSNASTTSHRPTTPTPKPRG